jgi:hypothetical protein
VGLDLCKNCQQSESFCAGRCPSRSPRNW